MVKKPYKVYATKKAIRDLKRAPLQIKERFQVWVDAVETVGMNQLRRRAGLHDEPLRGNRAGQRSVRLNRQWRIIYCENEQNDLVVVRVEEVTPHAY